MVVQRYGVEALDAISLVNLRMMLLDRVEVKRRDNGNETKDDTETTYNQLDNIDFTPEGVYVNGRAS